MGSPGRQKLVFPSAAGKHDLPAAKTSHWIGQPNVYGQ
jgi:hypothetical protein